MKIEDVRDIQIEIRKLFPPKDLDPQILFEIINILLKYAEK